MPRRRWRPTPPIVICPQNSALQQRRCTFLPHASHTHNPQFNSPPAPPPPPSRSPPPPAPLLLRSQVLRTSGLYETTAAYITDQPPFLNAAALARTALPPLQLLEALKAIEAAAGRDLQHGRRWGPRPLDLDIICYGGMQLALNVPAGGEGGAGGGAGTGASEVHAMPLLVPHQRCGGWWGRDLVGVVVVCGV